MGKKVVFNGIEILTTEDDFSARSFFDFSEEVIDLLEQELDSVDKNFNLQINTKFVFNEPPKHSISITGLTDQTTREKIMKILERTTSALTGRASGTVNVNLLIEDN